MFRVIMQAVQVVGVEVLVTRVFTVVRYVVFWRSGAPLVCDVF